jgi:hypothetical protein
MSFFSNALNALGDIGVWAYEDVTIYRRRRRQIGRISPHAAKARLQAAEYGHVERTSGVSVADFRDRFLLRRHPVIVADGTRDWPARELWNFEYFSREFGDVLVRLQDTGFEPRSEVGLRAYLAQISSRPAVHLGEMDADLEYLRYTYDSFFKHLLFTWGFGHRVKTGSFSFLAFQRIRRHWGRPYFLPSSGYRIPWVQLGDLYPNERMCQDWGLYFSAPGACTRLHVDGMRSNAVLCQVSGVKSGWIFSPSLEGAARSAAEGGDADEFPLSGADTSDRIWRFDLHPGEIMLIPRGLAHEVHTLSPSISVTYNFVTSDEWPAYSRYKSERGPGWIADAPIAGAPEFRSIYQADALSARAAVAVGVQGEASLV